MEVEGTEFVVTLGDGRVMRSRDLAGTDFDVRFAGQPMLAAGGTTAPPARTAAGRASRWPVGRMASS